MLQKHADLTTLTDNVYRDEQRSQRLLTTLNPKIDFRTSQLSPAINLITKVGEVRSKQQDSGGEGERRSEKT
jgi:hypothetical protein